MTNETLKKIKQTLNYALKNEFSDFYRNLYKNSTINPLSIKSYKDFQKLPILTKEDIVNIPLSKRIFVPENKIKHFSCTSGTTGTPLVVPDLFGVSDYFIESKILFEKKLIKAGAKKVLALFPPMAAPFKRLLSVHSDNFTIIPGDISKLRVVALISAEIKIDAIITSPTILQELTKHLMEVHFDFKKVKWISLGGELCSELKFKLIKQVFPEAYLTFRYGAAENGGLRGYKCTYLDNKSPTIYHVPPTQFLEIINEDKKLISNGKAGEILHTDLKTPKAFPLIRYLTGDTGSFELLPCKCGNNSLLKLGGRMATDMLKVNGVIIHKVAIEEALYKISGLSNILFRLEVSETKKDDQIKTKMNLYLPTESNLNKFSDLEKKLAEKLYLSANKTLTDLVNLGYFYPLEVTFVDNWPKEYKPKCIVSLIN